MSVPCYQDGPCFGKTKIGKEYICTVLNSPYAPYEKCPNQKPRREETNGVIYPIGIRYRGGKNAGKPKKHEEEPHAASQERGMELIDEEVLKNG